MRYRSRAVVLVAGLFGPWLAMAPATADDLLGVGVGGSVFGGAVTDAPDDRSEDDKGEKRDKRAKSKKGLQPGELKRAEVVKAGWWWLVNEPPPETGLLAGPQPVSPNTPQGTFPVASIAGDPEKVSAIEVRLKADTGAPVKDFTMVLRESAQPQATLNADAATILACPVTELFWADGNAAAWKNRPAYDCADGVPGKRSEDGLWSFDLTDLAAGWLTEGSTDSTSVVLVEDVEAPESFQVSFDGPRLEGIGLLLKAGPAPETPTDEEDDGDGTGGTGGSTGSSGGGSTSGGSSGGSLGGTSMPPSTPGGGAEPASGDAVPAADDTGSEAGQVALQPVASPSWYSGLPKATYLMLPLVLALAYLVMLALGPDARPVPATGRHGVSRALDRLRQAGRRVGAGR